MAQLNINVSDVQPSEGRSYDPIPAGWYVACITGSEICDTRAGTGHYLKLEFTILEGEYLDRKVWTNLNLNNPNPKAVEIAYADLSAIGHAVGVTNIVDSEMLHGKPLEISVSIRPPSGEYAASNEVKGYRPVSGGAAAPAAHAAPVAHAATAAPAAAGAPPWANRA